MTHFARIVTRGNVGDIRSDAGALDFFTVSASPKLRSHRDASHNIQHGDAESAGVENAGGDCSEYGQPVVFRIDHVDRHSVLSLFCPRCPARVDFFFRSKSYIFSECELAKLV